MTKNEFYTTWLKCFASGISSEDLARFVVATGNYLWHIFSWELMDTDRYLTGDAAKKAYREVEKSDTLYIDWFQDDEVRPLPTKLRHPDQLDKLTEVYVVSSDFSWTYIKTHESMCGPYFMKLS